MKSEIQTTISNQIANAGAASAASTGMVHYLSEHASVIGLCFTAATFLVFVGFGIFDRWPKIKARWRR